MRAVARQYQDHGFDGGPGNAPVRPVRAQASSAAPICALRAAPLLVTVSEPHTGGAGGGVAARPGTMPATTAPAKAARPACRPARPVVGSKATTIAASAASSVPGTRDGATRPLK